MSQTGNVTPPASVMRKNKVIDDDDESSVISSGNNSTSNNSTLKKKEEKKVVKSYDESESGSDMDTDSYSDVSDSGSSSSSGEEEDDDGYLWTIAEEDGKDVAVRRYEHRGENKNPATAVVMQTKKSKKINFPITVKDNKCSIGISGYCMIKASHCLESGAYYYEVKIEESVSCDTSKLPDYARQSHYKCGWSLEQGFDKACCGYDKYSFGYGSREGYCFHKTKGCQYGEKFGIGDIIGCYIEIPDVSAPHIVYVDGMMSLKTGETYRTKIATLAEKSVPNSKIIFFKNGKFQGIAFSDIPYGAYFPAISLYMNASVTMKFEKNQLQYNPYECCPEHISPNWKAVGELRYRNKNTQRTPKKTNSQNDFKTPPSISKNNLKEIGKGASKQFQQSPSQNRHSKIASASIAENKKPKEKKEKSEKSHHHSTHGEKKTKKKKESNPHGMNTTDVKKSTILDKQPTPSVEKPQIELPPPPPITTITSTSSEVQKPEKKEKKKKLKPLKVITDETDVPNTKETKIPSKAQDSPRLPPTPSLNQSSSESPLVKSASSSSMPKVPSFSDVMPPSPVPQPKSTTPALDKNIRSPSSAGSSSSMKHSSSANSFEKSLSSSSTPTTPTVSSSTSINPTQANPNIPTISTPSTTTNPANDVTPVNKPFITNMSDKPIVQSSFPSIEQITPQTKERKSKPKSEGSSIMARSKNFTPKKVLTKKEDLVPVKTAPKRKVPSKDEEPVIHHHTVKLLDPKDLQQAKKPKPTPETTTVVSTNVPTDSKPVSPTKKRKTSKVTEQNDQKEPAKKDEVKKIESSELAHSHNVKEAVTERIMESIIPKPQQTQPVYNPVQTQTANAQLNQIIQDVSKNSQHFASQHNQVNQTNVQTQQISSQYERSTTEPSYSFSSLLLGTPNASKSIQDQLSQLSSNSLNNQSSTSNFYNNAQQVSTSERKQDWSMHQLQTQPSNLQTPNISSNSASIIRNMQTSSLSGGQDISPSFQSRLTLENIQKQENMRLLEQINNLPRDTQKQTNQMQVSPTTMTSHTPSFRELLEAPSTFNPSSSSQMSSSNNFLSSQARSIPSTLTQQPQKVNNANIVNYQIGNKDQSQGPNLSNTNNYSNYLHQATEVKQVSNQNNYNQYSQRSNLSTTNGNSAYSSNINNNTGSLNFTPHQNVMNVTNTSASMGVMNQNALSNNIASMANMNQMTTNTMMSNQNTSKYSSGSLNYPNMNQQSMQQINTNPYGGNMGSQSTPKQQAILGNNQPSFTQHTQQHAQSMMSNQQQQQYATNNIPRGFAPQQINPQQLGHQQQPMNVNNNMNNMQYLPSLHTQQQSLPNTNSTGNNFNYQLHSQPQQQQNNGQQSSFKYNTYNK